MNVGKQLTLAAAGVSVIAGALLVGRASARYTAPSTPVASAPSARALAAELAELRHGLARTQSALQHEGRARLAALANAASAERTAQEPRELEETTPELPAAPSASELRDELDARFSAEDTDAHWSTSARENARAVLSGNLAEASHLRSLDCKATLCRAEIEQPNADAHRAYLEELTMQPPQTWTGPLLATLVEDPPGSFATLVFLARAGTEL